MISAGLSMPGKQTTLNSKLLIYWAAQQGKRKGLQLKLITISESSNPPRPIPNQLDTLDNFQQRAQPKSHIQYCSQASVSAAADVFTL
jgi:hypothetical protein